MRETMIITIFFGVTIEMKAKGQRGTRSHCIMSFLQWSANGLASLLCSRKKIFVRLLIFRDIAWEDSLDRRGNLYLDQEPISNRLLHAFTAL